MSILMKPDDIGFGVVQNCGTEPETWDAWIKRNGGMESRNGFQKRSEAWTWIHDALLQ